MKRILTLFITALMAIHLMAIGLNDGSTKANAIEFDWDKGITHPSGTLWYRVDLTPLYDEDNPSLSLYLTNPSNDVGSSVDVSMQATVAGESESKNYTITARQYKTYTANASMLVRMKQTEIYLTLTSNGEIKLSAKVFEAADLDETCKDARTLNWNTIATQNPMYSAWWKVSLAPIKDVTGKDAKITITNTGSATVNLRVGQSLDCPSSGLTKRTYKLAVGESVVNTIPRSMITNVQPDEIYFGIENVESQISIKVETIDQPVNPVIPSTIAPADLHVTDTFVIEAGKHLYRLSVAEMRDTAKYEPEFTYRNENGDPANVTIKMAFEIPAYSTSNTEYNLAAGEEEIVVYKKNMLEGLGEGLTYIYLLVECDQNINFYGRFKHVREGKACKTNIDFGELEPTNIHRQEARSTQWYAIYIGGARVGKKDITVHLENEGAAAATVSASMAFSCPYIDVQEITRTIGVGGSITKKLTYSAYAGMAEDYVWIGLETSQDIKIWAETTDTDRKDPPDASCESAEEFDWEEGVDLPASADYKWYSIDMKKVRDLAAKFPTIFIQNQDDAPATIEAEMSLECPDVYQNESRSMTIEANGTYSKELSRNMFSNIAQDIIYLKIKSTQHVSFQVRLTEQQPGTMCSSAIPFNWTSGNDIAANSNQWVSVDLRKVLTDPSKPNVELTIRNKDNTECHGTAWLAYECENNTTPATQDVNFTLGAKESRTKTLQYSLIETASDSIVWIRIVANTTVHVDARIVDPEPFTPIACPSNPIELTWDHGTYTYPAGTTSQWYVIPKTVLQSLEGLITTPEIRVTELSGSNNTITAEVAYTCPIEYEMISQSRTLSGGQTLTKIIERTTMEQIMKKDIVYIRLSGEGEFEFELKLVDPNTGNDRRHALSIVLDSTYNQPANTTMWYKIDTRELKKDPTLHGKSIHLDTYNLGAEADVKVWVYEDVSEEDLIENFTGEKDKGHRSYSAGEHRSRNIPAYSLYGLGDVELYIRVESNQPLRFSTKTSEYAALADPIAVKDTAILAVPNVDYKIEAGNDIWYAICVPYIRNNYSMTDFSNVELVNLGEEDANVKIMTTWQDVLTFQVPERSRSIRAGEPYVNTFKEIVNKAIRRITNRKFDIEGTQTSFIEEQLRKYLTSDSLTLYFRIASDQPLRMRINMNQTTGENCINAMEFDWEHGNVNPKGTTWFRVRLDESRVPQGKDLKMHLDNWTDPNPNTVSATIYQGDCKGTDLGSITKTITTDTFKVLDRDWLEKQGWMDLAIEYKSDTTSHIWAELIDHIDRDTIDSVPGIKYWCPGEIYIDESEIDPIKQQHLIDPNDPSTWTWITYIDSVLPNEPKIVTYQILDTVKPLQAPKIYPIATLTNKPIIERGQPLDADAATLEIRNNLIQDWGDSIMTVGQTDSIVWEYSKDGDVFEELPKLPAGEQVPLNQACIALRYKIIAQCDTILYSDTLINTVRDTLVVTDACEKYIWQEQEYTTSVFDSVKFEVGQLEGMDSIKYLDLTILQPIKRDTTVNDACVNYTWPVNGELYEISGDYTDTIHGGAANGCDSILTLHLTINQPTTYDTTAVECDSFDWHGTIYTTSGDYVYTLENAAGCDSVITLHLTINKAVTNTIAETACQSYTWEGDEYTQSDVITKTFTAANGCDSIVTLTLTIIDYEEGDTTFITTCKSYTWHEQEYSESNLYADTIEDPSGQSCGKIEYLQLTITPPITHTEKVTVCGSYTWQEITFAADSVALDTVLYSTYETASGCDSIVTMYLHVDPLIEPTRINVASCNEYTWDVTEETYTRDTIVSRSFEVGVCDSLVTLYLTILHPIVGDTVASECNLFTWRGVTYYNDTIVYDTIPEAASNGCDSIVRFTLDIAIPYENKLQLIAKYGDRLLLINREQINKLPGWNLDMDNDTSSVRWYRESEPQDEFLGFGYYYTNGGNPVDPGIYYATIDIPPADGSRCGAKGETEHYTVRAKAGAPALVPTLALPGQEIQVINLDPELQTTIRIYSTDGLLQGTYTTSGESTFTIEAAEDSGFYLVELSGDGMKSTLRYIVK